MEKHPRLTLEEFRKMIDNSEVGNDDLLMSSHAHLYQKFFVHPCRVDAYVIMLCMKGKVTVQIDLDEYEVNPQKIFITTPENIVQIMRPDDDVQLFSLAVTDHLLKNINVNYQLLMNVFIILSNTNQFCVSRRKMEELRETFLYIEEKIRNYRGNMRDLIFESLFTSFFYQLYDVLMITIDNKNIRTAVAHTRKEIIMKEFVRLLRENHTRERSVAFYANALNISAKHLSKVVKEVSKRTVMDRTDYYVVLEAKNMLMHSEMNVQEIAAALNFSNQSFFSQYFKRHTSMTPQMYRNKINNKYE